MQDIMNQFKKIAPFIVSAVKSRITPQMTDAEILEVVHAEILSFFAKGQQMTAEVLTFNADQRAIFAAVMYELLKPLADQMQQSLNPNYEAYVQRTGKTGALNFITNA